MQARAVLATLRPEATRCAVPGGRYEEIWKFLLPYRPISRTLDLPYRQFFGIIYL